MNRMGGFNVTQANPAFGLKNPFGPGIGLTMLGGAAGAYQGMQSLLGDQSIGEAVKDTYENIMGAGLAGEPEKLAQYNQILGRTAATPTPDVTKPIMADVAGPDKNELNRFKTAWDMAHYGMPSEEVNWYGTGRPDYEKSLREYQNWNSPDPYFSDPETASKFKSLYGMASGGLAYMLGE